MGIDWERRMTDHTQRHRSILSLPQSTPFEERQSSFFSLDYFITDLTVLGHNFCLFTGRPVVFVETKLKFPERMQTPAQLSRCKDFPEVVHRGWLAILIEHPRDLVKTLDALSVFLPSYAGNIRKFWIEFSLNLGTAASVAVTETKRLVQEHHPNRRIARG